MGNTITVKCQTCNGTIDLSDILNPIKSLLDAGGEASIQEATTIFATNVKHTDEQLNIVYKEIEFIKEHGRVVRGDNNSITIIIRTKDNPDYKGSILHEWVHMADMLNGTYDEEGAGHSPDFYKRFDWLCKQFGVKPAKELRGDA